MYSLTEKEEYAVWAKKCLLDVESFKKLYPEEKIKHHPEYDKGIPSVDPAFFLQPFIYGYLYIKESGILSNEEKLRIENSIKSSVNPMIHFPEWGAHNRSMLRVWSWFWQQRHWVRTRKQISGENWQVTWLKKPGKMVYRRCGIIYCFMVDFIHALCRNY